MYKSLILSKIDYGSIVYGSARKTQLKPLDSIQRTSICMALGAFRTSRYSALCVEANLPPLGLRRDRLLLNYGTRIWAQEYHPNFTLFFGDQLEVYEGRPTITKPAGYRFKSIIRDEFLPRVVPHQWSFIPPWRLPEPFIDMYMKCIRKGDIANNMLQATFQQHMSNYERYKQLFTDGSKTEEGVGSALITPTGRESWSLHPDASIFTAEMHAIQEALRYCATSTDSHFIICSDSESCLTSMRNRLIADPMVLKILSSLYDLKRANKNIIFLWIPSHVGIQGNELADTEARQATAREWEREIQIRPDDFLITWKNRQLLEWHMIWRREQTHLKILNPSLITWNVPKHLERREQVVVERLRLGHTNLTSMHLLQGEPPPRCQRCNVILTVTHILLSCPMFSIQRNTCKLKNTMIEIFKEQETQTLLTYLKSCNLFRKMFTANYGIVSQP